MFGSSGIRFDPDKDIPSLDGKIILVTGGNTGLGKQTVLELSKHNPALIWLASRSVPKAEEAIEDIKKQINKPIAPISILELDLSSFASVRAAARRVLAESPRLDILVLNAGFHPPKLAFTEDGYESSFGTNHMGHALLTKLLLPLLLKTAKSTPTGSDVRVVVLSSGAHMAAPSKGFDFDEIKNGTRFDNSLTIYGRSKLANVLWAKELADQNPSLTVVSLNPGLVNTEGVITASEGRPFWRIIATLIWPLVAVTVEKGTHTQLWAATAEGVETGKYYDPVGVLGKTSLQAGDQNLQKSLWKWTEAELQGHA